MLWDGEVTAGRPWSKVRQARPRTTVHQGFSTPSQPCQDKHGVSHDERENLSQTKIAPRLGEQRLVGYEKQQLA
jgi:hypothetical protein